MRALVLTACDLIEIYVWVIFFYVLLSWVPQNGIVGKIYDTLGIVCEPFLKLFRKIIPPIGGGSGVAMDISPIIAFLTLQLLQMLIRSLFL